MVPEKNSTLAQWIYYGLYLITSTTFKAKTKYAVHSPCSYIRHKSIEIPQTQWFNKNIENPKGSLRDHRTVNDRLWCREKGNLPGKKKISSIARHRQKPQIFQTTV